MKNNDHTKDVHVKVNVTSVPKVEPTTKTDSSETIDLPKEEKIEETEEK